jgi:hypothetical protein
MSRVAFGSIRGSVPGALAAASLVCLACGERGTEPGPERPEPQASAAQAGAAPVLAPSGRPYSEEREPCAVRHEHREVFWGELHVHSALSMDAWLWDVRGTPDDVYRFAKGEEILLPPLDEAGAPTRPARLERPLDFAALTDHASYQGEVALCTRPGSPKYDSEGCRIYRGEAEAGEAPLGGFAARMAAISRSIGPDNEVPARDPALCGEDLRGCIDAMRSVWEEQQAATERHYDRSSACRFTSFHGYEYTATPGLSKVHHNVIFRNARVPAAPIPWVDEPDVYGLWAKLRAQCLDAGTGCDVLTIPHNSNLSNGRMFVVTGRDLPLEVQRSRALLRARLEPLVEISQIKGDSECRNGTYRVLGAPDEFCDFEEWRPAEVEDCQEGTGTGALGGLGCVSRLDYVRYALVEGLREQARIGVNPYKLGILAATDAHNANPGDVEEYSYDGWRGLEDDTVAERLSSSAGAVAAISNLIASPGGLAAVWAEENSRDALFDAMQRREVFGTSGPRMTARFFGGWEYAEDLCDAPDLVAQGYAGGVPMGGDLPPRPEGAGAPLFVVSALRDPGIPEHPGGLLQRAQVVKGWLDDEGAFHQAVYDVAGGPNGARVDLDTCETRGPGSDALCAVWRDPDFDAQRRAVYYLRVLENPSCRWNQRQCNALPESERPEECASPPVPRTIQERLWTSPIWYDF